LHASTTTTFRDDAVVVDADVFFERAAAGDFFVLAFVAAAFLGGDFFVARVFGFTGGVSSAGAFAASVLLESRDDLRLGAIVNGSIFGRID